MTYTEFLGYLLLRLLVQLVLVYLLSGFIGALSGTAIDAVRARGDTTTQARQGALLAGLALAASPFVSLPHGLARGSAYIPSPVSENAPSFSAGLHIGQLVHLVLMLSLVCGTGAVLGSTVFCRSLRRAGEARIFSIACGLFAVMAAMLVLGYFLDCHGLDDPSLCR